MKNKYSLSKWRRLEDGTTHPARHFAVEEALLRGVESGMTPPTLRLRRVVPSVFIGIYQHPKEEVDTKYCQENDIPIIRRPNPGGAVYQDNGSFCFTAFFPKKRFFQLLDITKPEDLYKIFAEAVIDTCSESGVHAEFSPVNDVTVKGRKIFGSAQVELYDAFAHSGTFLVKTDREEMQKILSPSQLKFRDKGFTNVKDRVINLSEALGKDISVETVMSRMACHIGRNLGIELIAGCLRESEIRLAEQLYKEKYSLHDWTFSPRHSRTTVMASKAESGIVRLYIRIERNHIREIHIGGDFLIPDQRVLERLLNSLQDVDLNTAIRLTSSADLPEDIRETVINMMVGLQQDQGEQNVS